MQSSIKIIINSIKFFVSQSVLNSILKLTYTKNLFFHEIYHKLWIIDL